MFCSLPWLFVCLRMQMCTSKKKMSTYTSNECSYVRGPLRECLWARWLRPTLLLHTTCVRCSSRRLEDLFCTRKIVRNFSSAFPVLWIFLNNIRVNTVISWNGHNSFLRIFLRVKFSASYYTSAWEASCSDFFFKQSRSNVNRKHWLTDPATAAGVTICLLFFPDKLQ